MQPGATKRHHTRRDVHNDCKHMTASTEKAPNLSATFITSDRVEAISQSVRR
jgi:hypothetical protein